MFYGSFFNKDISNWDVSKVTRMEFMFAFSKFNKDISKWDVSKVKNMKGLFRNTKFCYDLTDWKPIKLEFIDDIFEDNKAPIPYWVNYRDKIDRIRAIGNYVLNSELKNDLSNTNKIQKKLKI